MQVSHHMRCWFRPGNLGLKCADPASACVTLFQSRDWYNVQVDAGRSSSEPASSSSGPQTPAGRDKENADANGSGLDLGSREPARKSRLCLGKRLRTA
jgi:hypothetical protein